MRNLTPAILHSRHVFLTSPNRVPYFSLERYGRLCTPALWTPFDLVRLNGVLWPFAAGRFLAAAGRLARNCLRRCASFCRAFSMGSSALFLPAHATHSSGAQSPQPILRAKTWLLSICLAVGEYRAELCANSFERVRMLSFSFSVAGCRFCVCRNHPLISACKLSLLVVPTGSRMFSALEKRCRILKLLNSHSARSPAAAWCRRSAMVLPLSIFFSSLSHRLSSGQPRTQ